MSHPTRLNALDGFRGVAIIAVILNHLPLSFILSNSHSLLHPLINIFTANGKTGVSILFLLTGFLMAWLNPIVSSPIPFWSRRFARLFPAFLVMTTSLTIIKVFHIQPFFQLAIVILVAIIARALWQISLLLNRLFPFGKFLTIFWIGAQAAVALWYSLYLLRIPSPVYYQTWPQNIQHLITLLVNSTLTLPFGNYIGQLDGVYWSLITEVSFYLLYPVVFLPVITFINKSSSFRLKIILALLSLPFCYGLKLIADRFLGFSIMTPYLSVYFIAGVVIGSNLDWFQTQVNNHKLLRSQAFLLFSTLVSVSSLVIYPYLQHSYHPWVQLLMVFPLSLLLIALTIDTHPWFKIFIHPVLVIFGKYSYSLYLTHSLVISILTKYINITGIVSFLTLSLFAFGLSFIISALLYQLIEAPYYKLSKTPKSSVPDNILSLPSLAVSQLVFLLFTYLVFLPPLSFFAAIQPVRDQAFFSNILNVNRLTLSQNPLTIPFTAQYDNLGTVTAHILHTPQKQTLVSHTQTHLLATVKDDKDNIITQTDLIPSQIIQNRYYPIGFPIINDSHNRNYYLQLQLKPFNSSDKVELIADESTINLVYFFDKYQLIKQPQQLFSWFILKITSPLTTPAFWSAFLCLFPLLSALFFTRQSLIPEFSRH